MRELMRLRLPATLANIPETMDRVADLAASLEFDRRSVEQIRLVVDEACANVVSHAYGGVEPGDMEVVVEADEQKLVIRVRDWGRGFDLSCVPEPMLDAPLEDRDLGGLGLFLVRHFMDQVECTCDPVLGNELVMVKRR